MMRSRLFCGKDFGVQIKLPSPDEENEEEAKDETSGILGFYTDAQITTMADIIQENPVSYDRKDATFQTPERNPGSDQNLRRHCTVRTDGGKTPYLSQDASAQVAHAISTHKIQSEFDFIPPWMICKPKANRGGHMGSIEYDSTLYRYANVGLHLLKTLGPAFPAVCERLCSVSSQG